ncbi:hypothetical protein [Streptomyces sp. NPDC058424]|uniref:hypothetical protein n=1 Tax=Streptomyces sp. NPDC058424 TaxID=3346491 RepID=UPI003646F290
MLQATGEIRNPEGIPEGLWPVRTQAVSHVGDAYVVQASGDFDLADLTTVRCRFPDRHVTLDGDVITVWPSTRQDE